MWIVESLGSAIMHLVGIALITAHYGALQEDYHSVAANPSFLSGVNGAWLSFTAPCGKLKGSLIRIKTLAANSKSRL